MSRCEGVCSFMRNTPVDFSGQQVGTLVGHPPLAEVRTYYGAADVSSGPPHFFPRRAGLARYGSRTGTEGPSGHTSLLAARRRRDRSDSRKHAYNWRKKEVGREAGGNRDAKERSWDRRISAAGSARSPRPGRIWIR